MTEQYDGKGYYKVLEVSYDAPSSLIKQQFYDRAKFWHPDHNEAPEALDTFQKISIAYDILKDSKTRLKYDLLSLVYKEENFPQINALKIYKNQKGKDDLALRVLRQRFVVLEKSGAVVKERKDICNFKEAKDMVVSTSITNWIQGWWGKGAFQKNKEAIRFNKQAVFADDADNLTLLIHNALAYEQENHIDAAWVYAKQALMLAHDNPRAEALLTEYVESLDYHPQKAVKLPRWSANALRARQNIIPTFLMIFSAVLAFGIMVQAGTIKLPKHNQSSYFEQRVVSGELMPYDMIDSRIIKVDGDFGSTDYLYHLKENAMIYHGPDPRYDPMEEAKKGQTVRIIGYTPNKKWMKIMIDNGNTGYLPQKVLEQGIGNPLPGRTSIYRK